MEGKSCNFSLILIKVLVTSISHVALTYTLAHFHLGYNLAHLKYSLKNSLKIEI